MTANVNSGEIARRKTHLSTYDFHRLNRACARIYNVWGAPYLVGSVLETGHYRDVDLRVLLDDEEFDQAFPHGEHWELACLAYTAWLRHETGLPIDFQFQRRDVANERFGGKTRNALGLPGIKYAGGGDGTS